MRTYSILCVTSNGFLDVLYTDIPDYMMAGQDIEESYTDLNEGFHKITEIKLARDPGQMGDFGRWEIAPYYYIEKDKVEFVMDCLGYVTKGEKMHKAAEQRTDKVKKLKAWVSTFHSADGKQYDLCSLWGDSPALRLKSNGGFTIYETVKQFDSPLSSVKSVNAIRKWIKAYFTENGLKPASL